MGVNKEHKEFHAVDMSTGWETPAGYPTGIQQKILSGALDKLITLNNEGAAQAQARSKDTYESTWTWGVVAMVLGLVLSAGAALAIIRGVTRSIDSVVACASAQISNALR